MSTPFRADAGRLYLRALFLEECQETHTALYTLKDSDQEEFKSLYLLYMQMSDPTEIEFARKYFENLEHWKRLCDTEWFAPYIMRWREELELDIQSKALAAIRMEAESATKNSFAANKFLVQGGWKRDKEQTPSRGKGRPSKDDINRAADKFVKEGSKIEDDIKRLGLQ